MCIQTSSYSHFRPILTETQPTGPAESKANIRCVRVQRSVHHKHEVKDFGRIAAEEQTQPDVLPDVLTHFK